MASLGAAVCLALQGVGGCSFAAPLAAMKATLQRTLDPGDPAYGFLRPDAQLVIGFISATPECSVDPHFAEIFDPDGDRRFWSDPTRPTPGLCWNAGVRCIGNLAATVACIPENRDIHGDPGAREGEAVLLPVAHSIDFLHSLVDAGHTAAIIVTALAGVAPGSVSLPLESSYSCAADEIAAAGICPGCTSEGSEATPPVRLAALAEAFLFDVQGFNPLCSGSPQAMWNPLGEKLGGHITPYCVDGCIADADPTTAQLDPQCEVIEAVPGEAPAAVPPCDTAEIDAAPEPQLPVGASVCHAFLRGPELSEYCAEIGNNAELRIIRNSPSRDHACISIRCAPSEQPRFDCPWLHEP